MPTFERQTTLFVVRLWVEGVSDGGEPRWRGQIESVGTGEIAYFQDAAGLLEAVERLAPGFIGWDGRGKEKVEP